jgi:hypothetical protein
LILEKRRQHAVGGAIGVQICTTVIAQSTRLGVPDLSGYTTAFWLCAAALIGATVVSSLIPTHRTAALAPEVFRLAGKP